MLRLSSLLCPGPGSQGMVTLTVKMDLPRPGIGILIPHGDAQMAQIKVLLSYLD